MRDVPDYDALSKLAETDRKEFARQMTEICMGPDLPERLDPSPEYVPDWWFPIGLALGALAAGLILWVIR